MRPTHIVPGIGAFRELTLWKAIVLTIATLGIYHLVLTYQNTQDIQKARQQPLEAWRVLFWVGVIPPLGFLHLVLYVFNGLGYKEFRERQGRPEDPLWIVALVLVVLAPVGQIIWAVTFNGWLRERQMPVEATIPPMPSAPA